MTLDDIKAEISRLPDEDIPALMEWLRDYNDGAVWNRQMETDVERLGAEEFRRRLLGQAELSVP